VRAPQETPGAQAHIGVDATPGCFGGLNCAGSDEGTRLQTPGQVTATRASPWRSTPKPRATVIGPPPTFLVTVWCRRRSLVFVLVRAQHARKTQTL